MADSKNFKDVGLNNENNQNTSSTPSSDFDRLEDCNEAEFRGATLSLSQETSPAGSLAAGVDSKFLFFLLNYNYLHILCEHFMYSLSFFRNFYFKIRKVNMKQL